MESTFVCRKREIERSFLCVKLTIDNFAANLVEKLIYSVNVLIGRGFNGELAVGHVLPQVLCKDCWDGSICGQVTLASNNDNKHLLLLALQVIIPLAQLVKGLLIIDGIAENTDTGVSEEEMGKVVDRGITSCIPNIQLDFMLVHLDQFGVVLNHICSLLGLAFLRATLHEGADD